MLKNYLWTFILNNRAHVRGTKPISDSYCKVIFLHGVLTGRSNSSCLKISNSSMAFSQGFLKTVLEERAADAWSVCDSDYYICCEHSDVLGNLSILVPTILKAAKLSSAYSHSSSTKLNGLDLLGLVSKGLELVKNSKKESPPPSIGSGAVKMSFTFNVIEGIIYLKIRSWEWKEDTGSEISHFFHAFVFTIISLSSNPNYCQPHTT